MVRFFNNYRTQVCPRCNGTGYLPWYRHIQNGICFLCWGNNGYSRQSSQDHYSTNNSRRIFWDEYAEPLDNTPKKRTSPTKAVVNAMDNLEKLGYLTTSPNNTDLLYKLPPPSKNDNGYYWKRSLSIRFKPGNQTKSYSLVDMIITVESSEDSLIVTNNCIGYDLILDFARKYPDFVKVESTKCRFGILHRIPQMNGRSCKTFYDRLAAILSDFTEMYYKLCERIPE